MANLSEQFRAQIRKIGQRSLSEPEADQATILRILDEVCTGALDNEHSAASLVKRWDAFLAEETAALDGVTPETVGVAQKAGFYRRAPFRFRVPSSEFITRNLVGRINPATWVDVVGTLIAHALHDAEREQRNGLWRLVGWDFVPKNSTKSGRRLVGGHPDQVIDPVQGRETVPWIAAGQVRGAAMATSTPEVVEVMELYLAVCDVSGSPEQDPLQFNSLPAGYGVSVQAGLQSPMGNPRFLPLEKVRAYDHAMEIVRRRAGADVARVEAAKQRVAMLKTLLKDHKPDQVVAMTGATIEEVEAAKAQK